MKINEQQREKLNQFVYRVLDTVLFDDDFDEMEKILTEDNSIPIEPPVILPKPNSPIFTIREVERMLADQRLSCMKQRYYYRYKGVKKMEEAILNAPPPQEFIDKIIVKIP